MKKAFLLLLFICISAAAFADMVIVQKVHSGPMMGQPAKDGTMTIYVKGKKERMDFEDGTRSMVIDLDANKMYTIDHTRKQVMTGSLDMVKQMGGMMSQMSKNAKTTVNKTGKSDTVNGFKCDEYAVNSSGGMMNMDGMMCVSSSVDTTEFEPFKEFGQGMMKMIGSDELLKLKGLPVRSTMKMSIMGQNVDSTSEVLSIKHESVPESKFAIPADYTQKQMPTMPQAPPQQ